MTRSASSSPGCQADDRSAAHRSRPLRSGRNPEHSRSRARCARAPQVGLLLDDVPAVVAPRCRVQAEPPRDMETTADVADRAVEDLEFFGVTEPLLEGGHDLAAPWNSAGPRGSSARIVAAGSKQSAIRAKSRAAIASRRRPATDHLVVGALAVDRHGGVSASWLRCTARRPGVASGLRPISASAQSVDVAHADQPVAHREQRGRAPGADAELDVDVFDVGADGLGRDGRAPGRSASWCIPAAAAPAPRPRRALSPPGWAASTAHPMPGGVQHGPNGLAVQPTVGHLGREHSLG